MTKIREETNLAGVLKSQLTTTGLSFTAKFSDNKTGIQRTPQGTTLNFTINKNNSKAERIRCTVHSTDSAGITTLTITALTGRDIPMYGVGSGTTTGRQHEIGDPIGCVTEHENVAQILNWLDGNVGNGAASIAIGTGADVNTRIYIENGDVNRPYIGYNAASNTFVIANDGSSESTLPGGAGAYTAGDGLSLTAGDFDIDLTDTVIFVQASSGAADSGKVPRLNASGELALGFIPIQTLSDGISDVTVTASQINNVVGTFNFSGTSGEAINGSVTEQALCQLGENFKHDIPITVSGNTLLTVASGTNRNIGDVDALTNLAQSFTVPTVNGTVTLESVTMLMRRVLTPGDNMNLLAKGDTAGSPGTLLTGGTSSTQVGNSLDTNYQPIKLTFTNCTLTSGATIWLDFDRSGVNNAANYYQVLDAAGNTYAGGSAKTLTASSGLWAALANDIQMQIVLKVNYGGKIYRLNVSNLDRTNFVGFTSDNVAQDIALTVKQTKATLSGLSGGVPYYGDSSAGAVTKTPSTSNPLVAVGRANSATSLQIAPGVKIWRKTIGDFSGTSDTKIYQGTLDWFFKTGFMPDEITFRYVYYTNASTTYRRVVVKFVGEGRRMMLVDTGLLNASSQYVTATTVENGDAAGAFALSGVITILNREENGFVARFVPVATQDFWPLIEIEAIQY